MEPRQGWPHGHLGGWLVGLYGADGFAQRFCWLAEKNYAVIIVLIVDKGGTLGAVDDGSVGSARGCRLGESWRYAAMR